MKSEGAHARWLKHTQNKKKFKNYFQNWNKNVYKTYVFFNALTSYLNEIYGFKKWKN